MIERRKLLTAAAAFLAVVCAAGAVWTAYWSLRFGVAPRLPLSPLQTAARVVIVLSAVTLLPLRRDSLERATLLCTVVAAGSSALFGFGLRSMTLDIIRLLFHFIAYALGFVVCVRWLARLWRAPSSAHAA